MISLGVGEFSHRHDPSGDGVERQRKLFGELPARFLCFCLLGGVAIKDRAAILPAPIPGLGIDRGPEFFDEGAIADDGRVEVDGNRLGMILEPAIAWIRLFAATIPGTGAKNSSQASELGIRSPKSSRAKGRRFVSDLR